jgi:glucosamine-6-phosphate deaminase
MILRVFGDKVLLGQAAAKQAAAAIRRAIAERGVARVVAASAASQIEFLESLIAADGIDWTKVELFHLDEYIGLAMTHPASFCKFLQERLIGRTGIRKLHLLNGEGDAAKVIRETNAAIASAPIDISFVGIGENGHLAFNDPPADFETEEPFIIVALDQACRQQQVGEGWFANLEAVPTRAISMSVRQVLKAREILAVVPDGRKAKAIAACFDGAISNRAPASILRSHGNATVYLDTNSAALVSPATLAAMSEK